MTKKKLPWEFWEVSWVGLFLTTGDVEPDVISSRVSSTTLLY